MCGPDVGRTVDSGDLIAIIHPNSRSNFRGRLKLSNRTPGATTSQWQSDATSRRKGHGPLNVRIHKYGRLLDDSVTFVDRESTPEQEHNPVMHSFFINHSSSNAGMRLNLSVGGEGIIGRTISILDAKQKLLGQGIIGWG